MWIANLLIHNPLARETLGSQGIPSQRSRTSCAKVQLHSYICCPSAGNAGLCSISFGSFSCCAFGRWEMYQLLLAWIVNILMLNDVALSFDLITSNMFVLACQSIFHCSSIMGVVSGLGPPFHPICSSRCSPSKRLSIAAIPRFESFRYKPISYPIDPWCWYIYRQDWVIFKVNVTIYSSTMDPSWDIVHWCTGCHSPGAVLQVQLVSQLVSHEMPAW